MQNEFYYIGTGEQTKMYTLRVRWMAKAYTEGGAGEYWVPCDYYCWNLSTDAEKAEAKAKAWSEATGNKLDLSGSLESLADIHRRSSEEVEAARQAAEAEMQARREEYEQGRRDAASEYLLRGCYPFGKYKGYSIADVETGYALYMLEADTEDQIMLSVQEAIRAIHPNLENLPEPTGNYFSEPKAKFETDVTLVGQFSFNTQYGTCFIQRYIADCGALLVYKGSAPQEVELGERVTIKGSVKAHDEYEGENQTTILRVKVAERQAGK